MQTQKLFELDLLRVMGMLLILYSHSTAYLGWSPRLNWLLPHPGAVGLSLFFFMSGFLLKRSLNGSGKIFKPWTFFKNRSIRIFPLYWLSIAVFVLVFHYANLFHSYNFDPVLGTTLAHVSAIQLLLSSEVAEIPTLWYVGALIPYYILFAVGARLTLLKFFLFNVLILVSLYYLQFTLQSEGLLTLDTRLLVHYPTFLLGVCFACFDQDLTCFKKCRRVLFPMSIGVSLAYIHWIGSREIILSTTHLSLKTINYYGYCLLWATSFITLAYLIAPYLVRFSSRIVFLSTISYSVYLFHRPVYAIFYGGLSFLFSPTQLVRTLLFPLATIILVIVSNYITLLDLKVLKPSLVKIVNRHDN